MENKYYINEQGLVTLVQSISNAIIQHTSGEITFSEVEDPQTGETEIILDTPNNFTTVKAVVDYLKDRDCLRIVYDTNSAVQSGDYTTTEHSKSYNGEEEVQIDMKLVTSQDINSLFE